MNWKIYWGMLSHIHALLRRMEPLNIFGNLRNPCIYNRAYLEPQASSKACRKCKISCIFKALEQSELFIQAYSRIFKHLQGYWCIFSHTLTGVQLVGDGRPLLQFWKIEKSSLIFQRKTLILSIFGLNSVFKMWF